MGTQSQYRRYGEDKHLLPLTGLERLHSGPTGSLVITEIGIPRTYYMQNSNDKNA
jgi:hypothetical protein